MGKERTPAWRLWALRALLFVALTAVTWPVASITRAPGLDGSWTVGLQLGVSQGLVWGRDLVYTYGPWGFGAFPVAVDRGTLLASLLLAGALQLLMVGLLYVAIRRQYGPLVSALLTFLTAGLVGALQAEAPLVAAFVLALLIVTLPEDRRPRLEYALAVGAGCLAALTLLTKLNDGVAVTAILALALASGRSPKRDLGLALGSGAVAIVALWLIAGQPLTAIFDYLRNGADTISGYVEAMGLEDGTGKWQLPVIVGSAITISALAWRSFPGLGRRRLGALLLAILAMHYFVLREVYVRHTLARGAFLAVLIPVALAIPWPWGRRGVPLTLAALLAVGFFASYDLTPREAWGPKRHAQAMYDQLKAGTDSGEFDAVAAEERQLIAAADQVPAGVAGALRGRCVAAEPTEIAAVWGYGLEWCPLPAMQSYAAFTPRLDQLDAARYEDAQGGPDGVLRAPFAIDGRQPAWESPEAMLALLCNFESAASTQTWQALVRIPDRCGAPRPFATVSGKLGEAIQIPPAPPGQVLIGRVGGMGISFAERVAMLLSRPAERFITIDGEARYRVVPGTLEDGLILAVPPKVDYPKPFNLGLGIHTLTPEVHGSSGGEVTIKLTTVPIEPFRARSAKGRQRPPQ